MSANARRLREMRESWARKRLPSPPWIKRYPADDPENPNEPIVEPATCTADFRNPKCWEGFEQQVVDEAWLREHHPGWLRAMELDIPRAEDGTLRVPRFCPSCERIALSSTERTTGDTHGPDPLYPDPVLNFTSADDRRDTDWMYGT